MKRLVMIMLALCASAPVTFGADYYLKSGATDLSVAASYTTGSAGGADATTPPGSSDEVWIPAGTFAIAGDSSSFTTLSGVKRVRPNDGAILEFIIDDTRTFDAPINYNGGYNYNDENNLRCYGKLLKKGNGTLVLSASGKTRSSSNYYQDYMTQIELREGTLKLPQYTDKNMYFGDIVMSNGTTLVTCGNMADTSAGIFTYVRSFNGDGIVTNETGRSSGQSFSPYTRNIKVENVFRGRICFPAKLWLQGSLTQYGTDTGIQQPVVVEENYGHLADGKSYGVYSFDNVALFGPQTFVQLYGRGGGIRYVGATDTVFSRTMALYTYGYPAFVDAGAHGGLTFTGSWTVNGTTVPATILNVQKWLVLTGSNEVPCKITGSFGDSNFGTTSDPLDSLRTIFTQKLGSGTWEFAGKRNHGGGFAIEEGTLRFDSIFEKGIPSALGLSTNLTTACSVRDPAHVDYAFQLGSTNASVPEAVFEYTGSSTATCTTRPLVLVGKGGYLGASNGRLTFGGISARDANSSPTLTLTGTGSVVNVARNISDGATGAKVNVVKDGTGSWALAGDQTFTGDITVKNGTLSIKPPYKAQYADYKWFRLSVAQIGNGGKSLLSIRQICLFDKDGVRQNLGLVPPPGAPVIATNGEPGVVTLPAVDVGPGQVYYDKSAAGHIVNRGSTGWGGISNAFNGVFQTYVPYVISWRTSNNNPCYPSPSDKSTWIPIVMHLPDSANPITHIDIESFSDSPDQLPTRICLEASHNGYAWEEVYSNVDTSQPLLAQGVSNYNRWISDGTGAASGDYSHTPRPLESAVVKLSKSGDAERTYFSWFRFSIAQINNGGNIALFRQVGIYDVEGNRLNAGLTMAETVPLNTKHVIAGTVPQPGQVGFDASAAGRKVQFDSGEGGDFSQNFNENGYNGTSGCVQIRWYDSNGTDLKPDPGNRNTWISMVMHLDKAVAAHHFDVQVKDNEGATYRIPRRFMLEGSADGERWHVLYNNATEGDQLPTTFPPTQYNTWVSDGVQASNSGHSRPAGKGLALAMSYVPDEAPATQFPDGVNVQVLAGATLTAEDATQTIKSLRVDSSGAGTLDGFTFADSGTIDVVFSDGVPGPVVLSGTYVNCTGQENIAGWAVKLNGSRSYGYRAKVVNGTIVIVPKGMTISFK